jgi:uncharacterized membrane protein
MKKLLLFLILIILLPFSVSAQSESNSADKYFKAEVIKVIKEQEKKFLDGTSEKQQNLSLRGLEGEIKGKIIEFKGIGDYDVISKNIYKVGDKVLVIKSLNDDGGTEYYVTDYVRDRGLLWLALAFIFSLLIVGGWKGLRSLLSLVASFFVIIKYIIPMVLKGQDPIITTVIGSFIILLFIIYLTEGFRTRSHITVLSIFLSLIITIFLSWFFVGLTKLTGAFSEEVGSLAMIGGQAANFKGLLLAGIIIGTLGVLDDVVISQVAAVEQLYDADRTVSRFNLFKNAYNIGVSHISSMTNTLFLAYVGVSLPLLILFLSGQSAFSGWGQAINNEEIATEIVRTLAGSIGLILAVPLSTLIAVFWIKKN